MNPISRAEIARILYDSIILEQVIDEDGVLIFDSDEEFTNAIIGTNNGVTQNHGNYNFIFNTGTNAGIYSISAVNQQGLPLSTRVYIQDGSGPNARFWRVFHEPNVLPHLQNRFLLPTNATVLISVFGMPNTPFTLNINFEEEVVGRTILFTADEVGDYFLIPISVNGLSLSELNNKRFTLTFDSADFRIDNAIEMRADGNLRDITIVSNSLTFRPNRTTSIPASGIINTVRLRANRAGVQMPVTIFIR